MLVQILCDKNFRCHKETLNELDNKECTNTSQTVKNGSNTIIKEEENVIVCQPNCTQHHISHSCPDYTNFKNQTSSTFSPSFKLKTNQKSTPLPSVFPDRKVNFDNQSSSLRFLPSLTLNTNQKSTLLPSFCPDHKVDFEEQTFPHKKSTCSSINCNQTAQIQTQPSDLPTRFQTAVDIESTPNFDKISTASYHSA